MGRCESIDQRQPVETFAEPPREIVVRTLAPQSPPLRDLRHGHAEDQNVMNQRRAVSAKFPLGVVQPSHGLALALGDRLPRLPAIDVLPGWIDRARPFPNHSETPGRPGTAPRQYDDANACGRVDRCGSSAAQRFSLRAPGQGDRRLRPRLLPRCAADPAIADHAPRLDCTASCASLSALVTSVMSGLAIADGRFRVQRAGSSKLAAAGSRKSQGRRRLFRPLRQRGAKPSLRLVPMVDPDCGSSENAACSSLNPAAADGRRR
jgi:hypothetical protein